jgi:hypothetical protein
MKMLLATLTALMLCACGGGVDELDEQQEGDTVVCSAPVETQAIPSCPWRN